MMPFEEARAKIVAAAQLLKTKKLPLNELSGHVLAEPIIARFDLPSFDNSAVDGYGVLVKDLTEASLDKKANLELLGEMKAGSALSFSLTAGSTVKILTGAVVPPSVEAVVMRENCEQNGTRVIISDSVKPGENIRRKGAEVKAGDVVLQAGKRIGPPELGLIATVGESHATVYAKPRVALVVTGDELVPPGSELKTGQIFDSNSYALRGALLCMGINECPVFYAKDTLADTVGAFSKALESADVVISSGGVSVGDHDYVKDALEKLSVQTLLWRIAIKPGKPVYVGKLSNDTTKLIFGLPGNPVSVLITYHQFVKPALKKMMGVKDLDSIKYTAKLSNSIAKKAGRLDLMRGRAGASPSGGIDVTAVKGQDSHMLTGLSSANCLLYFTAEDEFKDANSDIQIEFIDWTN